jgi:hypothetical protein
VAVLRISIVANVIPPTIPPAKRMKDRDGVEALASQARDWESDVVFHE